jgi:hypothetical protein
MKSKILHRLITLVATGLLVACSGGGGGGGGVAGIDRLGVSTGVITGFGSIILNEGAIGTNGADFIIDDSPGSEDDLDVGDVVIVTFDPTSPNPNATTVFSNEIVEGPIDSIDNGQSQLVVAGQTVRVDGDTSFDDSISPASLDGLAPGQFVEISGLFDANGIISATRIEPGTDQTEVHGTIENLNAGAQTFQINALLVDYGAVPAIIDDFAGGVPVQGAFAEVKGTNFGGAGELLATKVEADAIGIAADDRINFDDFDEVEIEVEGFITRFASATDFDVDGIPVTTNGQTVFEFEDDSPATPADIGLNTKVEVEGDVSALGVLVADKVDIRRGSSVRITALVDSANGGTGIVTLLGIDVRVDAGTRIEDKWLDVEPFTVGQINAGDYVEVRGTEDVNGSGDVLAARLERDDPPNVAGEDTELQGFVTSVTDPSFIILGVTIQTNGGTVFRDETETVIPPATFFAQANGRLVDVSGFQSSQTVIVADEVELDN